MSNIPTIITDRKRYSLQKISSFQEAAKSEPAFARARNLAVYTTGSYGRLKAGSDSDLDAFCIHDGTVADLAQVSAKAAIVKIADTQKHKPFSNDGEYLQCYSVDEIIKYLGTREDDFKNHFTARMLLLLESQVLVNKPAYEYALKKIVSEYFRDFNDHPRDFVPLFLINDIVRYWKTICLNYETKRFAKKVGVDEQVKRRLKNKKLKFSRIWTCYSMVASLSNHEPPLTLDELLEYVHDTPYKRMKRLCEAKNKAVASKAKAVVKDYTWFLKTLSESEQVALEWLSNPANNEVAADRAKSFNKNFSLLLRAATAKKDLASYLII
jgi:hypothetical protein